MTDISLTRLSDIDEAAIIDLMNDPSVRRHMPLLDAGFSAADCRAFRATKQEMWDRHGFGPQAILIDGQFAGWGGLQPQDGDADFALVLHPAHWGAGLRIFRLFRDEAFGPMGLDSITALLPPDRANRRAILRLGFVEEGPVTVDGAAFIRFRLHGSGV